MDYDKLKKDTYLFLLSNNDDAKKLIYATLLISLCHDKCIKDDKLMVSPSFIKKCNLLVPFETNYDKMISLNDMEKFSLIRNKLCHGDFVYKEESGELYFKHNFNGNEVMSSMKLSNVLMFAEEIINYYDFLGSELSRERIVIYQGLNMTFTDKINVSSNRSVSYNKFVDMLIVEIKRQLPRIIIRHPKRRTFDCYDLMRHHAKLRNHLYNPKKLNLTVSIEKTKEPDTIINNPYANLLEKELLLRLNDKESNYQEVIDLLSKLYVIFIYPLENFLKKDDHSVKSLQNNQMFDFSLLDINMNDEIINVSKTIQYNEELSIAYEKLGQYHTKLDKLRKTPNISEKIKNEIQVIEEEIDKLKDLFCNNSVKLIYSYSKNRSIVEHLRCSLMHGSYTYNEIDDTFKFSDYWKGEDQFNKTISLKDFRTIFNDENISHVMKQFSDVYGESIGIKK